jgi:hypothetical protein
VPAAQQSVRVREGGPVEGGRDRCPPVDQDRLLLPVGQPDPADVGAPAVGVVHGTEAQPALGRVEPGEPVGVGGGEHVPLDDRLRGAGAPVEQYLTELLGGDVPDLIQPGIQGVDICLLAGYLGSAVRRHRISFRSVSDRGRG